MTHRLLVPALAAALVVGLPATAALAQSYTAPAGFAAPTVATRSDVDPDRTAPVFAAPRAASDVTTGSIGRRSLHARPARR